ncbi:hypothetical protein [uncultured Anaerococcus sp.]|uniref:hypothetical protein n=1 Tax=uncultured Anaerococcus sp. TaxID=293428 RepID=UPI0025D85C3B|nr:hypothetical protein [uncultured Anaerococcus sp.]
MKDFKKILKLSWKRYAIWIILVGFFFTLANTLGMKSNIKRDSTELGNRVSTMERYLETSKTYPSDKKIDKAYLKEAEKTAEDFRSKYKLKYRGDRFYDESYFDRLDDEDLWDKQNNYEVFKIIMEDYEDYEFNLVDKLTSSMVITLVFILILAMALTSIEESLNYYDFTRMLPWSKKKEFLMKVGLCLIFGLILFVINIGIVTAIAKGSVFSEILSFKGFGDFFLKLLIAFVSTSLVGVGLGLLAGNFIGHLGLSIIAVGFIDLFSLIGFSFASIFSDELPSKLSQVYYNFKDGLSSTGQVFLSLTNTDFDKISSLWAGLVVSILIALIAYFLIGKSSAERSGYMVKNKTLSVISKWIGILCLTSIIFVITNGLISRDSVNILVRIIIYALSLLISYKLFDILFRIRLKF